MRIVFVCEYEYEKKVFKQGQTDGSASYSRARTCTHCGINSTQNNSSSRVGTHQALSPVFGPLGISQRPNKILPNHTTTEEDDDDGIIVRDDA